jgi:alpha-galactosidase
MMARWGGANEDLGEGAETVLMRMGDQGLVFRIWRLPKQVSTYSDANSEERGPDPILNRSTT